MHQNIDNIRGEYLLIHHIGHQQRAYIQYNSFVWVSFFSYSFFSINYVFIANDPTEVLKVKNNNNNKKQKYIKIYSNFGTFIMPLINVKLIRIFFIFLFLSFFISFYGLVFPLDYSGMFVFLFISFYFVHQVVFYFFFFASCSCLLMFSFVFFFLIIYVYIAKHLKMQFDWDSNELRVKRNKTFNEAMIMFLGLPKTFFFKFIRFNYYSPSYSKVIWSSWKSGKKLTVFGEFVIRLRVAWLFQSSKIISCTLGSRMK